MLTQFTLTISTPGRSLINITDQISQLVAQAKIQVGLCNIFLQHTSASLILCEHTDPLVQRDLETFMHRLIPDGDPMFQHVEEGPDDMSSHVRSVLTQNFLVVPITDGQLALGRWQGIYLWEHRFKSYERRLIITIQG